MVQYLLIVRLQVTSLVHMSGGKVYDPLIGQWMAPVWGDVLNRVTNPRQLHLYRFNGNDPINVGHPMHHLAGKECTSKNYILFITSVVKYFC